MQQAAQAEASGPQLLPSRVLLLSKHVRTCSHDMQPLELELQSCNLDQGVPISVLHQI